MILPPILVGFPELPEFMGVAAEAAGVRFMGMAAAFIGLATGG
jgi:hypothetical protein